MEVDRLLDMEVPLVDPSLKELPIVKRNHRRWNVLQSRGDDVSIRDPKLRQGYLGVLEDKTPQQLTEVLTRMDHILNNRAWWSKMGDQGERVRAKRREVAAALEKVRAREQALEDAPLPDMQAIEWRGGPGRPRHPAIARHPATTHDPAITHDPATTHDLDSDDEPDPLHLMATHSATVKTPRANPREEEKDPSILIAEELEQLNLQDEKERQSSDDVTKGLTGDTSTDNREAEKKGNGEAEKKGNREAEKKGDGEVEKKGDGNDDKVGGDFGVRRIQMMEKRKLRNGEVREPFKPYKPSPNPQPIPGLQAIINLHRPKQTRRAQVISMQESIALERDYFHKQRTKDLHKTREALGRMKDSYKIGMPPSAATLRYRDVNETPHLLDTGDVYLHKFDDEEDEEYGDEEEDEEGAF